MCCVLVYTVVKNTHHGHVFVEGAPFLKREGNANKYNWEESKITLQLNTNDLDKIIHGMAYPITQGFNIEKNNKFFSFKGTTFTLSSKELNTTLEIELTPAQNSGLLLLMQQAKLRIYGWAT